ncbi:MAG: Gfo/Idh/MocA family protein [Promethearchaeota archaeon]
MENTNVPITAVMIGAGNRGFDAYGTYATKHPNRIKMIAVAEPNKERRLQFQNAHHISDSQAFTSWEKVLNSQMGKIADLVFICVQDSLHFQPAKIAIEMGYSILLEKPISPNLDECRELVQLSQKNKTLIQVGHVLRYTRFWKTIKDVIDSGKIGKIIHYDHSENVSYWHFGHSYVRGNWKNKDTASPVILAKSCHDLDLMTWLMDEKPLNVQASGELTHFCSENAPPDAADRCTDGCPHASTCYWYAPRLYLYGEPIIRETLAGKNRWLKFLVKLVLNHRPFMLKVAKIIPRLKQYLEWKNWPSSVITTDLSQEGIMKALREGPYGRCIYKTRNDVVDHHIATFQFPSGATGTFTVHGLSDLEGREIRIFGSKGSIRGIFRFNNEEVVVTNFGLKPEIVHQSGLDLSGHGGGDYGMMDAFTSILLQEQTPEEAGYADIATAMESHYMAFAAEDARLSHATVDLDSYR